MKGIRLSIRLLFAMIAVVAVVALFATQWGPELDGNGNPLSASDGFDQIGFPFTHRVFNGGDCEQGPCGGSYDSTTKLIANYVLAAAGAAGFGLVGWRLGGLATRILRVPTIVSSQNIDEQRT